MFFWLAVVAFFVCAIVLAWDAQYQKMDITERPRVLHMPWFSTAKTIGGIGFLAIPAMFYWRDGFMAAAIAGGTYLLIPVAIAVALRRLTG